MNTEMARVYAEPTINSPTMRRPGENRAAHRARLSQQRTKAKRRKIDTREEVREDLTVVTFHPTKGRRVISGKRIEAQDRMAALFTIAAVRANGKRNLRRAA